MINLEQFRIQQIDPLKKASLSQPHPNFFIVGAGKAGTTSLWEYLKQHPQIAMPAELRHKEPCFFSAHYPYRPNLETYLGLFADAAGKKAIGESSHAHLTSPESAEFIKMTYPDAKIIIILRNPVERAFSLYQWMLRDGYEWLYPFEKALSAEDKRLKDEHFEYHAPHYYYNYLYYHSGLYSEQVLRYTERFPKEQIKILLFDDLKSDAIRLIQELYRFLEVDPYFIPQLKIHNKAQTPLFVSKQYFFRTRMPILLKQCYVPKPIRKWLTQSIIAMNISLGKYRSLKLNPATRHDLLNRYQDDIDKTSQLIERNLDMWLTKKS